MYMCDIGKKDSFVINLNFSNKLTDYLSIINIYIFSFAIVSEEFIVIISMNFGIYKNLFRNKI